LVRFHRHWNLLFNLSWLAFGLRQQLQFRIGTAHRDCTKQLFSMNESAIYRGVGPGTGAAAEASSLDAKNGERISANLPRINTEGAMPTI
jgi:hypothetical protein